MHRNLFTRAFYFSTALFLGLLFLALPGTVPGTRAAKRAKTAAPQITEDLFQHLEWRNLGPASMGGRLTDIEGVPGNPDVVYVASASGGVWKTTNGGITWKPIFDRAGPLSIGDIALQPGNPDVIWVGTGEDNPRNSVSFGNGVYKSTDGGKTWKHMGLEDTERISRIIVHPTNPDIVYVAAIGHIFGPNPNRGVYMTTDGGKTWKKVLYIDEYHGASDLEMDPSNPNILYAGMWYFQRKPWTHQSGSEKGGLFKSIDGGRTWKKLTKGLPKLTGRIAVKVAPSNPNVVYALIEAKEGALWRSDDRGESFRLVYKKRNIILRGFYFTELRVAPDNENKIYSISSPLWMSIDGGKTWKRIARAAHGDFHTVWIDPTDPNRVWIGDDGGLFLSNDGGQTVEYVNNVPVAQFYQIWADNREPFYYICGGLQDNGSWCGPSRTRYYWSILNDFWHLISYGDGFWVVSHPDDPDLYLSEYQGGGIMRTNYRTGQQQDVSPQPKRNDGGPVKELKYRFNWNAPIVPSPHDPKTVYFGGNVVFKSPDFGSTWEVISPDLTTNDPKKQGNAGGPIYIENTTAEYHCTIISLAESPAQAGLIWAGTDDGNLQVTTDGGKTWTNVIKNVRGLPPNSPVSHVEPSRYDANVAYVAFDRHMFDDFRAHIYKTTDLGKTWRNISGNLPRGAYVHVVREDPRNPKVLYAGTERGLFVSFTGGGQWIRLRMKNLPHVAVHDIIVHPRDNDLILGTHGRGIWVFDDITPVQELTPDILAQPAHLFSIRPALRFSRLSSRSAVGNKAFRAPNPPYGALLTYYLKEKVDKKTTLKIQILDANGKVIRELKKLPREAGLHRVNWNLAMQGPKVPEALRQRFFREIEGPEVLPGTYTVKLIVGDQEWDQKVEVRLDPTLPVTRADLEKAFHVLLQVYGMGKNLLESIKQLGSVRTQMDNLQKTLKSQLDKVPEDVQKEMKAVGDQLKKLSDELMPETDLYWSRGPNLVMRLMSLVGDIDGANAAPTPYQLEYFQELKGAYTDLMKRVNEFLGTAIPKLNQVLEKNQIEARIMVRSKIKLES